MKSPLARPWHAASFMAGVLIGLSIVAPVFALTGGECESMGNARTGRLGHRAPPRSCAAGRCHCEVTARDRTPVNWYNHRRREITTSCQRLMPGGAQ